VTVTTTADTSTSLFPERNRRPRYRPGRRRGPTDATSTDAPGSRHSCVSAPRNVLNWRAWINPVLCPCTPDGSARTAGCRCTHDSQCRQLPRCVGPRVDKTTIVAHSGPHPHATHRERASWGCAPAGGTSPQNGQLGRLPLSSTAWGPMRSSRSANRGKVLCTPF